MKILILQDDYWPNEKGGSAVIAKNLAEGYVQLGHEVVVVTTVQEKSEAIDEEVNGVFVRRMYTNYHLRWRSYKCLYNPCAIKYLKQVFREFRPDILHAHNVHMFLSYYALVLSKRFGANVYLTVHDTQLITYGKLTEFYPKNKSGLRDGFHYYLSWWTSVKKMKFRYNPIRNIVIKFMLRSVTKIVVVSKELEKALLQYGVVNTAVIYNGISISNWKAKKSFVDILVKEYALSQKKVILFGGRISVDKGYKVMIDAFRKITELHPNTVLLVIGNKNNHKLPQHSNDNFRDKIIFTGWISGETLKAVYSISDVVVTPSLYLDPFPTVNLEAMACEKPVVGTCFGGTPEVVEDNKTGIIVNPLNIQEVVSAVNKIIKNDQLALDMGRAGQVKIKEDFSLDKQIKQYLELFEEKVDNNAVV